MKYHKEYLQFHCYFKQRHNPRLNISANCKASYHKTTKYFVIFPHAITYKSFYSNSQIRLKGCITQIIKFRRWENYYFGLCKEV